MEMEQNLIQLRPKTTSQAKTSLSVLTAWLKDLARTHSLGRREPIVLTEKDFALYADVLSDLSVEQVDAAFLAASRTCRFFPTPADIRAQIDGADKNALQLEAERALENFERWLDRWYHPDCGILRGAPSLDRVTEHAARAAGSFTYLASCSEQDLIWARKRFIESYVRVHETRQIEYLLSDREAKQILRELAAPRPRPEQKRIPPVDPSKEQPPSRSEVMAVLNRVTGEPSEAELARRRESQKRGLEKWIAEHPDASGKNPIAPGVEQLAPAS
jgi:hypothetical protein